jgi:hypothetical protein
MKKSIKTQIEAIQDQIDAINAKRNNETLPLLQELNLAFDKAFDNSILIQELIKAAEDSKEYAMNEYGELSRWVRVDVKSLKEECLNDFDRLKDYLADCAVYLNEDEEYAEILVGDFIAIQEDYGDVFYCANGESSTIAQRQEYNSFEELKAIIQKFMDGRGYYPLVVKVGRYGDVRVVSV